MIEEENILPHKWYNMTIPVDIKIKEFENHVLIDFEQSLSWVSLNTSNALFLAESIKKIAADIEYKNKANTIKYINEESVPGVN